MTKGIQLIPNSIGRLQLRSFEGNVPGGLIRTKLNFLPGFGVDRLVFEFDDFELLVQEIQGQVGVALEQAHFAHAFHGNSAGRKICHRTVMKLNASIGNIRGGRDNGNTACADISDL